MYSGLPSALWGPLRRSQGLLLQSHALTEHLVGGGCSVNVSKLSHTQDDSAACCPPLGVDELLWTLSRGKLLENALKMPLDEDPLSYNFSETYNQSLSLFFPALPQRLQQNAFKHLL